MQNTPLRGLMRWNYARWKNASRRDMMRVARANLHDRLVELGWKRIPHQGNEKTTYVIGLFGSGRGYITQLLLKNIGERAKYYRHDIRIHPVPTSMIYGGHATMKYASRGQALPAVTHRVLESVRSEIADLIFVYRHPLDSLLTNWIWWRIFLRDSRLIGGISDIYMNTDAFCVDLEKNFAEFESFAEGDPSFFEVIPGPRFLSFLEFVEETELFRQSATLGLRLEDFAINPRGEFSKILKLMSVDVESTSLPISTPTAKPYRYLMVREEVPRFRKFISALNAETKLRIESLGYNVEA